MQAPILPRKRPGWVVPTFGLTAAVALWFSRDLLREQVLTRETIANEAPAVDSVEEMITTSANPAETLLAAWNSGKIVHREVAMASVAKVLPPATPLPQPIEAMVLDGTADADSKVREAAFGILRARNHPKTYQLALAQLGDPDQQVRLFGLSLLLTAPPKTGIRAVAELLNDADPAVAGMGVKLFERWSGEKFGSALSDTVEVENPATGLKEFPPAGTARTREAAQRAKQWWDAHSSDTAVASPVSAAYPSHGVSRVMAPDFRLPDVNGRMIQLSELRGKVVLINFWTTWCTACIGEIPALEELQRRHDGKIVILGVSLDFVPDEHGHLGGHPAVEDQSHVADHEDDDHHESRAAALKEVREKVAKVIKKRGINYPVLLDENNDVGGRYNGGELPTTVIVDAEGVMRRRFVGARNMAVFESMIAEAMEPRPLAGAAGKRTE